MNVRISIGFSVTSHGEGSLALSGRGFDAFAERQTHLTLNFWKLICTKVREIKNCYRCSTAGGSYPVSTDLPLDSSQTLQAPQE